jgi:hypothetical protein
VIVISPPALLTTITSGQDGSLGTEESTSPHHEDGAEPPP